ncbi:AAA family ATPase [Prescottella equi]|uniref:AAA family ATPase n=1 Tax=Rhodococcus hoagii TaxID=43767 RepID=UPI001F5B3A9E|nr:AAA family ATPase [Prescottella equi]UNQ36637.1 AAA family ATPase [Prescottella equi]
MQLKLVNAGLIREATIELADLSIIMGPNNSGKSTISTIAHAATKAHGFFGRRLRRRPSQIGRIARQNVNISNAMKKIDFAGISDALRSSERPNNESAALLEANQVLAERVLELFGNYFVSEIELAFGAPLSALPTRLSSGRRLPLKIRLSSTMPSWSVEIRLRRDTPHVQVDLADQIPFRFEDLPAHILNGLASGNASDTSFYLSMWADELAPRLFASLPDRSHYLPAARAGLLQSHRLVAAAMFQSSTLVGISEVTMPALSGVVADFVSEILLNDRRPTKRSAPLKSAAQDIETLVLRGNVKQLKTGSGYPELEFQDEAGRYPIHRTSSMVSELSPIVLLLRQVVEPGDLLIIEEPESHLHPATQTQLAKILFKVSATAPLMITTHSDFFLSQVNNEIRGQAIQATAKRPVSVLAYAIEKTDEGSYLRALPVDPLDGVPEDSFSEVSMALYDTQITQQNQLTDGAFE